MGCIAAKLECCVIAKCCHCIHLRCGCFIIASIAIVFWIGISLFFIIEEGTGLFFNVNNPSWVSTAYMTAILFEAVLRVIVSIILIIGAATENVTILTIFLVSWILLIILLLFDLIFAIAISKADGATILFSLAYTAVRVLFSVLAIVVANSYRIQLILVDRTKQEATVTSESGDIRSGAVRTSSQNFPELVY